MCFISSNERSSSWDSVDMTGLVWNTTFITAKPDTGNTKDSDSSKRCDNVLL